MIKAITDNIMLITAALMAILLVIEKTEKLVSPISWILTKIFTPLKTFLISDIDKRLDYIEQKVVKKEIDDDFKEIMSIKKDIANYAAHLTKLPLTMCQYDRIWELEQRYNFYVDKYHHLPADKRPNGQIKASLAYIKKQFEKGFIDSKDYRQKEEKSI